MRTIIHLDLDAFYCAVEELHDAALRGVPFAVGGTPEGRGVVASCSYAARRFGVRSAMPMGRALALCPGLQVVETHFAWYREASQKVMERLYAVTPLVEQISIDEAFLDTSESRASGEDIARQLQQTIRGELRLPCSLGVAGNKLVAKIANDVGKSRVKTGKPPRSICVVPPGEEAAFLAPLPVDALWGVGEKTEERLKTLGMRTIGDIARWPATDLARRFGKHGRLLSLHANGLDDRPIVTERASKSISKETTFATDISDSKRLHAMTAEMSVLVARQLRKEGLTARTVKLKLRTPDFVTLTRQSSLPRSTDRAATIKEAALNLLDQCWNGESPVRLVGVGVSGLSEGRQLALWGDDGTAADAEREERLRTVVEGLQNRFGEGVVRRGDA